jgi:Ca2+-transporting ATPase
MNMRFEHSPDFWTALRRAGKTFSAIDGTQRAAAFAYYAFFSLFPLILLLVTIGSLFFSRDVAVEKVIEFAQGRLPLGSETQQRIFDSVSGMIAARGKVGLAATLALLWGTLRIFTALVRAANRAWNTEVYNWWQMPLKNLSLVGVLATGILLGVVVPAALKLAEHALPSRQGAVAFFAALGLEIIPMVILFFGIAVFYRLAPRRRTRFSEVWGAAFGATVTLHLVEAGFTIYLNNFSNFNVVYGALGGLMALLMWIYLSGCIIIFGVCLTSAQAEFRRAKS